MKPEPPPNDDGKDVARERTSNHQSRGDRLLDLWWYWWRRSFVVVPPVAVGFAVCVGVPIGLVGKVQTLFEGMGVGALLGLLAFGLLFMSLTFVTLAVVAFETASWIWNKLVPRKPRSHR